MAAGSGVAADFPAARVAGVAAFALALPVFFAAGFAGAFRPVFPTMIARATFVPPASDRCGRAGTFRFRESPAT
jgi:hypothetical protein